MFEVNVKDALEALKNRFGALNAQQVALGTARGLNRAAAKGKTAANRSIREQYNIKARDVNKGLSTKLATRQTLESQIIAQGAGMPLGYFSPKRTPTGISVSIMKGERTTIQRAFFLPTRPSLVVARGNYEGGGSFAFRTKRTRRFGNDLPIAKMLTTSVPRALANRDVIGQLTPELSRYLLERIAHELEYLASKQG